VHGRNPQQSDARKRPESGKSQASPLWPLEAVNFFMADMQSGIGP